MEMAMKSHERKGNQRSKQATHVFLNETMDDMKESMH
jgi:hypothetical protein